MDGVRVDNAQRQELYVVFGRWLVGSGLDLRSKGSGGQQAGVNKILCVRFFKIWDLWLPIFCYFWLCAISLILPTVHSDSGLNILSRCALILFCVGTVLLWERMNQGN